MNNIDIDFPLAENSYRGSFKLSLLEIGLSKTQRKYQEIMKQTQAKPDDISGLGLNWGVTKALNGVQKLLHETEYKGHEQSAKIKTALGYFNCPILYVTIPKYLEAYELKRNGKNQFNRRQRDEALKNLESLSEARKIYFSKRFYQKGQGKKKGKWINQIVETNKRLIDLSKLYELPNSLLNNPSRKEIRKRYQFLKIAVSPLCFYDIDKQFILKPYGLFTTIKKAINNRNKKASKSYYNFIIMLLQTDFKTYPIFKENLIAKLELSHLSKTRQKKRINEQINQVIEVAIKLNYLLDYDYDSSKEKFIFKPNPNKCSRLYRKTNNKDSSLSLEDVMEAQEAWELATGFCF